MSIRQRATQCLGKQLPDKTHSRLCSPTSRWRGHGGLWHEEQENSKLIQTSSRRASVASERIFRTRETVKAWLESSPTSVIEDLDNESACPSSFESFSSSPAGSVDHLSYTTRFHKTSPGKVNPSGHARSRTISPPRRTANRNSVDVSRIDAAHYSGGSFLMLAFKNAQYRGSSSPPAFQYTSEDFRDDHLQNLNAEECGSPRSEFSITSEWQYVLAAANAAGMSTRDTSGNNSDFETTCEVLNVSDLDLDSALGNLRAHPHVATKPCPTRSMELPRVACIHDHSASGELKNLLVDDNKCTVLSDSTNLEARKTHADIIYDQTPLLRLSRRNSRNPTSMREAFVQGPKRGVQSSAAAGEEEKFSRLTSRFESDEVETKFWEDYQLAKATSAVKQVELKSETKHTHLMDKAQNEIAIARPEAEEKKAIAEAKRADKAARVAMEAKLIRQNSNTPRGCLLLG